MIVEPVDGLYVDTSALGRVLRGEPDAAEVRAHVARAKRLVSSRLLGLELRRFGLRFHLEDDAEALLANVSLVPPDVQTFALADGITPATVASLDAIHLATAVRLRASGLVDAVLTFDRELVRGAREHGLVPLPQ